ncbi:MAG: glycosyltransferase [Candidatus Solibacter sp.]
MRDSLKSMRLVITSHVVHYGNRGALFAYGPYAREIDLWADLFKEVVIASPYIESEPPGDCLAFSRPNISISPQRMAGGETLRAKLWLALSMPVMIVGLARALWRADAIHVRCPGNLGLLGCCLAPLLSRRLVAKYAAQWNPAVNEPWSARFQKFVLRSRWWRGPVTVYGEWPGQPRHVVPFFTSLLSGEHLQRARQASLRPRNGRPLRILYTGRLSTSKNVDSVIHSVAEAKSKGCELALTIVGTGPERPHLESLVRESGLSGLVDFTGGITFASVIDRLEQADVLVLTSETEGWPKSIAEGMAFGLVCIGANRGFVPEMLAEGRGLVVEPGNRQALSALLVDIAQHPETYGEMRTKAAAWAQRFSLEGLREAIHQLLVKHWAIDLPSAPSEVPCSSRQT